MKKLVVYYSLTGNTEYVASIIAKVAKADLLKIQPKKEIPKTTFKKYFWGGKQVIFKELPKLLSFSKNPDDYDIIFLGTPVWAGNFTPAVRSFLELVKLKDKKIFLFCTHEGTKVRALQNLENNLQKENIIIGKADFYFSKGKKPPLEEIKNSVRIG